MTTSQLPYDHWLEEALRSVIRRALTHTAEHGLPGDHHFYITFETGAEGVLMPEQLRQRYPDEMTIVLQHQFWELGVQADFFEVTLKFGGRHSRLTIPFAAVTAFGDPSVNFGLQLKALAAQAPGTGATEEEGDLASSETQSQALPHAAKNPDSGQVIALDTFRKK